MREGGREGKGERRRFGASSQHGNGAVRDSSSMRQPTHGSHLDHHGNHPGSNHLLQQLSLFPLPQVGQADQVQPSTAAWCLCGRERQRKTETLGKNTYMYANIQIMLIE